MEINKEVQKVADSLPVFYDLLEANSYVTVFDKNGIVVAFVTPPGVEPQAKVGEYFDDPSGGFAEVVKTKKRKYNYLPKEVMGTAFEGYLVPILDGGVVEGVVSYTHSTEESDAVKALTSSFKSAVDLITDAIDGIVTDASEMTSVLSATSAQAESINGDITRASGIVSSISANASKSNILALNASIEAARCGDAGKGFAVVATEMSRLAKDSSKSSTEISSTLSTITDDIVHIVSGISRSEELSAGRLSDVSAVKEKLEEIQELASKLSEILERK